MERLVGRAKVWPIALLLLAASRRLVWAQRLNASNLGEGLTHVDWLRRSVWALGHLHLDRRARNVKGPCTDVEGFS